MGKIPRVEQRMASKAIVNPDPSITALQGRSKEAEEKKICEVEKSKRGDQEGTSFQMLRKR